MESLVEFVNRFSGSVGCYYHFLSHSNLYSLKKYDSARRGKMGVFGWVSEKKRRSLFRVDTYKWLGDEAEVSDLADGVKKNMHFNNEGTGMFFYVKRGSEAEDYKKAIRALKAIMALR